MFRPRPRAERPSPLSDEEILGEMEDIFAEGLLEPDNQEHLRQIAIRLALTIASQRMAGISAAHLDDIQKIAIENVHDAAMSASAPDTDTIPVFEVEAFKGYSARSSTTTPVAACTVLRITNPAFINPRNTQ